MYKFMNKLGTIAYIMDAKHGRESAAAKLGAANKCNAGIAVADPIMV